jgi:hypothetical protein
VAQSAVNRCNGDYAAKWDGLFPASVDNGTIEEEQDLEKEA